MSGNAYRPRSLRAIVNWRRYMFGPYRASLADLFYCWRNSFYPARSREYDLATYSADSFFPDRIEGSPGGFDPLYCACSQDKVTFALYMKALNAPTPEVLAEMAGDRMIFYGNAAETLETLLLRHGDLVIKPRTGFGGAGVRIVSAPGPDLTLAPGEFVSTKVHQHSYADRINPGALNTIRVLTAWDHARSEHFVAAAVHRFGTTSSHQVDNWSRGGLSAWIDLGTARMGPALRKPCFDRARTWCKAHPDTHAPIEGVEIPRFHALLRDLLAVCRRFPPRYLGWDLVVTPDSWSIIEANSLPSLGIFQVHRPLFLEPRLRAFFRHEGVI